MGLQYLTFIGRNLENKKNLTPIQIMTSVGLKRKNNVNAIDIINDNAFIDNNFREFYWMNNVSCEYS